MINMVLNLTTQPLEEDSKNNPKELPIWSYEGMDVEIEKCDGCGSSKIRINSREGTLVCTDCGLVLE